MIYAEVPALYCFNARELRSIARECYCAMGARSVPVRRNAEQPRLTRSVPCDGAKKGKRPSGSLQGWVQRYLPGGRSKVPLRSYLSVKNYVRPSPANESYIFAHKNSKLLQELIAATRSKFRSRDGGSWWKWELSIRERKDSTSPQHGCGYGRLQYLCLL